ncbi:MAG: M20/M25/M40 family metallo-hydrolase [Proteobacteria bacterium]|nr:M20/M25/M40 family metallo-hydrolase [Pseudomonadota bacterium]
MLAATADFTIRIHGTGCHAATPHLGTDQVLIAARVIESLQSVRSRFVAPYEPLALSITRIHGGTANNIIPSMVELGGTLRTVDRQLQKKTIEHMRQLVEGLANLYGARAEIEICENYPATINHKGPTAFLQNVAEALLPANQVHTMEHPSMGGEDFAYFLQKVPGSYFFLGMDDGRKGGYPSLHHPDYDFNDAALRVGMKIFVHAALAYASYETEH